ncbi:MAG: hypothetical protein LBR45_05595, partial [Bacteroidales bacterium]|nr:hypothetical protein [Bacteroidales bacterium]
MRKKTNLWAFFAFTLFLLAGTISVKAQAPYVTPATEFKPLIENYHEDLWKDTVSVIIKDYDNTKTYEVDFISGTAEAAAQFEITSNTTLGNSDFTIDGTEATFKVALKAKTTLEASETRKNDTIVISNGSERIGYVVLSYTVYCSSAERLQDTFGIYATLGTSERTYTKTGFEFTNEFYPG